MSLTIQEFEDLIGEAYSVDEEIEVFKRDILKPRQEKLTLLEKKILDVLTAEGKTSYKSKFGTVVKQVRYSVMTPKNLDDKRSFFGWLKDKGEAVYWQYTSVNSNSLNALYKEEMALAKEAGNLDFTIPGIGEPTATPILARRSK